MLPWQARSQTWPPKEHQKSQSQENKSGRSTPVLGLNPFQRNTVGTADKTISLRPRGNLESFENVTENTRAQPIDIGEGLN